MIRSSNRVRRGSRPSPTLTVLIGALAAIATVTGAAVFLGPSPAPNRSAGDPLSVLRPAQFIGGSRSFDLSRSSLPVGEIRAGGPPKDGIPALTSPPTVPAAGASYLRDDDRVIGYAADGHARAYPLRILNYHEVVNDRVADRPIAVTYCPLCDSATVFDRRTPLGEREFGVSGLLYNSNVLLYDRGGRVESLWSQLGNVGVSGAAVNQKLSALPVELTTWADWRNRYPHTRVLSLQTGYRRNYNRDPYDGYLETPRLLFPAEPKSDRLPAKEPVLGVWAGEAAKAYPLGAFGDQRREVQDVVAGRKVRLVFHPDPHRIRVVSAEQGVKWAYALWFAWYAFHPETEVYSP